MNDPRSRARIRDSFTLGWIVDILKVNLAFMLLDVRNLKVSFHSRDGVNEAVRGISFSLETGKTLAIVGESGSGKSVTSMALTKLLPPKPMCQVLGVARLDGKSLLDLSLIHISEPTRPY